MHNGEAPRLPEIALRSALCRGEPSDAVNELNAMLEAMARRRGLSGLLRLARERHEGSLEDVVADVRTETYIRLHRALCRTNRNLASFRAYASTHVGFAIRDLIVRYRRPYSSTNRPTEARISTCNADFESSDEVWLTKSALEKLSRSNKDYSHYAKAYLRLIELGTKVHQLSNREQKKMLRAVSSALERKKDAAFDTGRHRFRRALAAELAEGQNQ